jgi:hypothetical protein
MYCYNLSLSSSTCLTSCSSSFTTLCHDQIISSLSAHKHHSIMRQHPQRTIVPPLAAVLPTPRVPNRIHNPVHAPHRAEHTSRDRVFQSSDEHSSQRGDVVLAEVLVGALRAVEGQHGGLCGGGGGLHLLVGGVFEGVRDLGCFAETTDPGAVPGADEEGRYCGEQDVAGDEC